MAQLVVEFKVMPDGAEADLEAIKAEVEKVTPDSAKLQGMELKPVAFGLKAIHVTVTMVDEEDAPGPDEVEEAYGAIDGVASVQIINLGRL